MGIESVDWFKSYLNDRKQMGNIDNTFSDTMNVSSGVPQGSILGPLLFLCYINDMIQCNSPDYKLLLYADDSAIIFSHPNPDIIAFKLSKALESCQTWFIDNKLSMDIDKTECILFCSKEYLRR